MELSLLVHITQSTFSSLTSKHVFTSLIYISINLHTCTLSKYVVLDAYNTTQYSISKRKREREKEKYMNRNSQRERGERLRERERERKEDKPQTDRQTLLHMHLNTVAIVTRLKRGEWCDVRERCKTLNSNESHIHKSIFKKTGYCPITKEWRQ